MEPSPKHKKRRTDLKGKSKKTGASLRRSSWLLQVSQSIDPICQSPIIIKDKSDDEGGMSARSLRGSCNHSAPTEPFNNQNLSSCAGFQQPNHEDQEEVSCPQCEVAAPTNLSQITKCPILTALPQELPEELPNLSDAVSNHGESHEKTPESLGDAGLQKSTSASKNQTRSFGQINDLNRSTLQQESPPPQQAGAHRQTTRPVLVFPSNLAVSLPSDADQTRNFFESTSAI